MKPEVFLAEDNNEPPMHPAEIITTQQAELEALRVIALAAWNVAVRSAEAHHVSVIPSSLLQDLADALTQSAQFFTPPPTPNPTLPYAYSDNLLEWDKPYSLEAAIDAAERAGLEVIYQSVPYFPKASSFLNEIRDDLADQAHAEFFHRAEGWPNTNQRQSRTLQKAVENTVDIWAKLNHLEPDFCVFEDFEEIPLEQARKML